MATSKESRRDACPDATMRKPVTPDAAQYCFDFPHRKVIAPRYKPRRPNNLYFGLKPSLAEADAIDAKTCSWVGVLKPGFTRPSPQCLHVSLASCDRHDNLPESLIAQLHDLMNGFNGPPIDIVFDRLGLFGGNAIVLYSTVINHAFQTMRNSLLARLAALPSIRRTNGKTAVPHMTVFRGGLRVPSRQVEPILRRFGEVLLIYSHNGAGRHTIVGRWRLTASRFDTDPEQGSGGQHRDLFSRSGNSVSQD